MKTFINKPAVIIIPLIDLPRRRRREIFATVRHDTS